jgi:hypothetical protein
MALKARNNTLGLRVSSSLLDRVCQRSTELLLLCLPQARKVAFYSVGPVPHLRITPVGAAERNREINEVKWRGSAEMDSDVSGKTWKDLLDASTGDLDVWSSCLRNQRAWTSSDSKDDFRRLVEKTRGKLSDNHFHLEPVLMRKADLWHSMPPSSVYPKDRDGNPLWLNSDHVTVALIKINLTLKSSPFDQNYWQVTEELTKTLAIQLLHLHSKQFYSKKMEVIQEERDELRETLITQIRKIISRLGLIYRIIDNEVAYLRQSWENLIHQYHPEQPCRHNIVKQLNLLLEKLTVDHNVVSESEAVKQLAWYQNKLSEFCFLPEENEVWFQQKILPLWKNTATKFNSAPKIKKQMKKLFDQLEQSFFVGLNKTLIDKIDDIPNSIKAKWTNLAYNEKNLAKVDLLKEYTHLLEEVYIDFPNKRKTLENLVCLRNLALYFENLEDELDKYIDKCEIFTSIEQTFLH